MFHIRSETVFKTKYKPITFGEDKKEESMSSLPGMVFSGFEKDKQQKKWKESDGNWLMQIIRIWMKLLCASDERQKERLSNKKQQQHDPKK